MEMSSDPIKNSSMDDAHVHERETLIIIKINMIL